jgi:hypothetical protein
MHPPTKTQARRVHRIRETAFLIISAFATLVILPFVQTATSQTTSAPAQLEIGGEVSTPLTLTVADLKNMPRTTLHVTNPHEKKSETYEGVSLEELLRRAGAPHGEQLRGALMTTYVLAEAEDGYKVVFALAELDPGFSDSEILVADTVDGAPIDAKRSAFRLIVPHDKRAARWVRMLKSITVYSPKD